MAPDSSREGYTGRQGRKARHAEEGFAKGIAPGAGGETRAWVKVSKRGDPNHPRTGFSGGPIQKKGIPFPRTGRRNMDLRRRAPAGVA